MADSYSWRPWRLRLWHSVVLAGGVLLITAGTWVAFRHGVEHTEPGLPVLGKLPEFSLVASSGRPFSQTNVAGEIWIADFVFTHCPGLCPMLSAQMAKVQGALVKQGITAQLVSFSVDPANDTPEALRAYAERFHADATRWRFVTGTPCTA
jgi:cytochrome oxidase Cu insertion factor (SCO1/SenC/PrrC family)